MKNITLSIPDKDYPFFIKLVKSLDFVKIKAGGEKAPTKKELLKGLDDAIEEVKQIKAGKKKGISAK